MRDARMKVVTEEVVAEFAEKYPDSEAAIGEVLYKLQKYVVRRWILDDGKRVDGRSLDQIRPLAAEVGLCRAYMVRVCLREGRRRY